MRTKSTIIALVIATSTFVSGQQSPFVGRWNLAGTGPDTDKVYWLEVTQNGKELAGRFLQSTVPDGGEAALRRRRCSLFDGGLLALVAGVLGGVASALVMLSLIR